MADPLVDGPERGSATIWLLIGIAVITVVMVAIGALGAGEIIRRQAAAAADAAALAGAAAVDDGTATACGAAAAMAATDQAAMLSCTISGAIVTVAVRRPLPGLLHIFGPVAARAAAGPGGVQHPAPALSSGPEQGGQEADRT